MTKSVDTLVEDIYHLFSDEHFPEIDESEISDLGKRMVEHIREAILEPERDTHLRMSNLGTKCKRKLWYKLNRPNDLEKLKPNDKIKFLFGHLIEELVLFLARIAGHKVEREQEELEYEGVVGHIDAIIDGALVDVKSASSFSFKKFSNHLTSDNDLFGYLRQLGVYAEALEKNGTKLDTKAFLAFDKQLGKLHLDKHDDLSEMDYPAEIASIKEMASHPKPPPRFYEDVPDGASGNRKLGIECSYCEAKWLCWPGLKQYNYANGPRFLTVVKREPNIFQNKE